MDFEFAVSIIICTRNRPASLIETINSIQRSTVAPFEVIISDDSTNDETAAICADRSVVYVKGPQRGLGANRNCALAHARGQFVSFLDDDAQLSPNVLELMRNELSEMAAEERQKTILTGYERHADGRVVQPAEQDFWGFQHVPYAGSAALKTVVINCALFPRAIFATIGFDEQLVYGADEVDFTTQAVARGYRIIALPDAVNLHFPSAIGRDYYAPYADASRLYVTFKRYFYTEKKMGKAFAFALLAPLHCIAARVKRAGLPGFAQALSTLRIASSYLVRMRR